MRVEGVIVSRGCPLDYIIWSEVSGPDNEYMYKVRVEYGAVEGWYREFIATTECPLADLEQEIEDQASELVQAMEAVGLPYSQFTK